jgi:hypothetical protein
MTPSALMSFSPRTWATRVFWKGQDRNGGSCSVEDGFGESRDATYIPGKFLSTLQDFDAPLDAPATATMNVGPPVWFAVFALHIERTD